MDPLIFLNHSLIHDKHYIFHDSYEDMVQKDCQGLVLHVGAAQYHWVEEKLVGTISFSIYS